MVNLLFIHLEEKKGLSLVTITFIFWLSALVGFYVLIFRSNAPLPYIELESMGVVGERGKEGRGLVVVDPLNFKVLVGSLDSHLIDSRHQVKTSPTKRISQ